MPVPPDHVDDTPKDISFADVFNDEMHAINRRRTINHRSNIPPAGSEGFPITTENGLVGLALSGGGLRSAAFCLGALQGLQSKDIIKSVDYLSTVSGGGYTGSTLTIGLSDNPDVFPFVRQDQSAESPIVKHLRDNSRYLLQNGLPSLVTALAVYVRGLASNVVVVLPLLLFLSALLLMLNADTAELAATRALLIDWSATLGNGSLRVSVAVLSLCMAGLVIYAVLVSVIPYSPKRRRMRGANIAGLALAIAAIVTLLDIHAALTALRFKFLEQGQDTSGWLQDHLNAIFLWLSPIAALIVPYVNVIATKATSGDAGGWMDLVQRVLSRALLLVLASLLPVLLWITVMQFTFWGTAVCSDELPSCGSQVSVEHAPYIVQWLLGADENGIVSNYDRWLAPLAYALLALVPLLLWPFINVNANSLHQLYRDRLGSAFFVRSADATPASQGANQADTFKLSEIKTDNAPYHLINAALNVPGSRYANRRGRNADFFFFSPQYIGSEATGYAKTTSAEEAMKSLSLGTATAVSGAAAAPNMGMASVRPLSLTIAECSPGLLAAPPPSYCPWKSDP